jgi:hypothetical protein
MVYGARAKGVVSSRFRLGMSPLGHNLSSLSIGRSSRVVVFLPHPNERGSEKTIAANIGDAGLALVHRHMAGHEHP